MATNRRDFLLMGGGVAAGAGTLWLGSRVMKKQRAPTLTPVHQSEPAPPPVTVSGQTSQR